MRTRSLRSALPLAVLGALFAAAVPGCSDDDDGDGPIDPPPPPPPPPDTFNIAAGDIAGDTTWATGKTYILEGQVFITSGTLTIQPGTTIKGKPGSVLVVTKNAKLNAVGTAASPIVFTGNDAPVRPGAWGGVVLLGDAPINVTGGKNKIEGFPDSVGVKIEYGGPTAAHDCGKLKYARIEYAGFRFGTDNELNGLTLGGCGTATEIDYVQSHLGLDDGVEIFGGTVNVRHLVITQPDDDGLDWDLGWNGTAQFVIVQQKAGLGDRGIEADSNNSNNDALPRSGPEIWNMTMIGGDSPIAKKQGGIHLRRGTAAKISNTVIAYFNQYPIDIDGASSVGQFNAGALSIKHTYFLKSTAQPLFMTDFDKAGTPPAENDCVAGTCLDEQAMLTADTSNRIDADPMLMDAKNLTSPNWKPMAASPVLAGCGTPGAGFDATATFCGAIGDTDWTAGWTRFPE
jgi:hypothetical protein